MGEYTLGGVKLFFEDKGQGVPLILAHGYPLDHTIWDAVVDLLSRDCRLIRPDLRGHGRSLSGPGPVTMDRLADDLVGLLDALQLSQAVLVGHSMGGYACLAFARRYSQRLLGLGLVATTSAADSAERAQNRKETARTVAEQGVGTVAENMPPRMTADPAIQKRLREVILRMTPQGVVGALLGMAERADTTASLNEIRVPTVIVAGEQDAFVPVEKMHAMAEQIPQARWFEVSGAGHVPMMEAPQVVAGALKALVRDVKAV